MKRFWKDVAAVPVEGGWSAELDGRPIRTPARELLVLPTEALAKAIADEWSAVEDRVDPRAMPLTGLANAAIDRVAPDKGTFAAGLAKYAEADLACYRANELRLSLKRRINESDPYYNMIHNQWGEGLRRVFAQLPDPYWEDA